MTCLLCQHSTAADKTDRERNKTLKAMALLGYVNCTLSAGRAGFRAFDHQCGAFHRADPATVKAREKWRAEHVPHGTAQDGMPVVRMRTQERITA